MSRAGALVAAVALSAVALLLVAGHGPWAGRVLLPGPGGHGLNRGDVPVLVLWAVGMAGCWRWGRGAAPRE